MKKNTESALHPSGAHPTAQLLAAYVEGTLPSRTREELEDHLAGCADCYVTVCETAALAPVADNRRTVQWWLVGGLAGLAAAAAIAFAVLTPAGGSQPLAETRDTLATAASNAWPLEARLSGYPYQRLAPVNRAEGDAVVPLTVRAAAQEIVERFGSDERRDARHAAAVAFLVMGQFDEAARRLQALAADASDALVLNDLAVALFERGRSSAGTPADFEQALAYATRASAAEAVRAEATFNRALILEGLGEAQQAREAWTAFLALDPASPFATTARSKLSGATPQ